MGEGSPRSRLLFPTVDLRLGLVKVGQMSNTGIDVSMVSRLEGTGIAKNEAHSGSKSKIGTRCRGGVAARHEKAVCNQQSDTRCCISLDPYGGRPWCRKCAAEFLSVTAKTLANWNSSGAGPRNIGRPGKPRYMRADLLSWLTDGQVRS